MGLFAELQTVTASRPSMILFAAQDAAWKLLNRLIGLFTALVIALHHALWNTNTLLWFLFSSRRLSG
jgi:hypothetical protein